MKHKEKEQKQKQKQKQNKQYDIKTVSISLAERRGNKIEKFKLPITKEKEDTTIEHIKPFFR